MSTLDIHTCIHISEYRYIYEGLYYQSSPGRHFALFFEGRVGVHCVFVGLVLEWRKFLWGCGSWWYKYYFTRSWLVIKGSDAVTQKHWSESGGDNKFPKQYLWPLICLWGVNYANRLVESQFFHTPCFVLSSTDTHFMFVDLHKQWRSRLWSQQDHLTSQWHDVEWEHHIDSSPDTRQHPPSWCWVVMWSLFSILSDIQIL